jgi:polyhydroxybutyrate depolymerase
MQGSHAHRLHVGGRERTYLVHAPPNPDGRQPLPVVVFLHGAGATARWALSETGWDATADREGFLVVLPEATRPDPSQPPRFLANPPRWNDGCGPGVSLPDDVAFLGAVLDDVAAHFAVDRCRVYVTGFSNGAAMTFRLAAELAPRLAAVAPVAGHCCLPDPRPECPVPTCYLVGAQDPLIPLEGGVVRTPWGHTNVKPAVRETLRKWAHALGLSPDAVVAREENGVRIEAFGPREPDVEFLVYTIAGLGHHWPGGRGQLKKRIAGNPSNRLAANDVILDFFRRHALP